MIRDQQGFTLAELLVVLTIVVLTAALALPGAMGRAQRGDLPTQAAQVAALLRLARTEAILRNGEQAVSIDLEARRIGVAGGDKAVSIDADVALAVLTARDEIVSKTALVRFLPDGSSTGGAVTLERKGMRRRVKINWLTGAITIDGGGAGGADK